MPEALSGEAFLPCLLDRLTDDEPERRQEPRHHLSITMQHLRRVVLRDLRWLLNAAAPGEAGGFGDFSEVPSSVLNFGAPDLSGRTASSLNLGELERAIARSIERFEPRILSLVVRALPKDPKGSPHVIGFSISGVMWANPVPERFVLETKVDLETGQCEF